MLNILKKLYKDEEGQGLVEYGLIIALVAIAVTVALKALGGGVSGIFADINEELGGTTSE